MGYQFIHLESYARKADAKGRSTDFIFSEASRKPEASVHVANPLPPVVVYGLGVQEVQEMHDAAASAATITVKGGHVRKVAKDKKTLHTVVASYPATMAEIHADPAKRAEAEEWEKRTIAWLRSQYGDDLKSAIRHEDESHYHLHAYIVPVDEPGMSALKYHPGVSAKRKIMSVGPAEGEDAKALGKRADAAYKAAMREWQDSYHEAVAVPCGLTRLGPQRRRLTREEWQREQVQAEALQKTVQQAKRVKASGDQFIARVKNEADAIRTAAARDKEAAEEANAAAMAAREQAEKAQEKAEEAVSRAERYSGISGRLRAMWDALGESKLATKIREEFAAEIARVQAFARSLQTRLKDEEKRRHEAERKAHEAAQDAERARDAALRMQIERDRAWSLLPPERQQELAMSGPAMKMTLQPSQTKEKR
ncbi:Skp family chaperone for outer membrane proteins [Rhizobium sp. BK316]|uniref:plasmid recombination protein n=1 Tax=Rhizobium sp. BK316 TaxID=2587053 RepID=UPI0016164353|nr:plasmid recombination protein [Rhizobium sp. BK316]MBB3408523.1 Skp family chaperone for outer membrane proteins [Rhizobium sp. BK316]